MSRRAPLPLQLKLPSGDVRSSRSVRQRSPSSASWLPGRRCPLPRQGCAISCASRSSHRYARSRASTRNHRRSPPLIPKRHWLRPSVKDVLPRGRSSPRAVSTRAIGWRRLPIWRRKYQSWRIWNTTSFSIRRGASSRSATASAIGDWMRATTTYSHRKRGSPTSSRLRRENCRRRAGLRLGEHSRLRAERRFFCRGAARCSSI